MEDVQAVNINLNKREQAVGATVSRRGDLEMLGLLHDRMVQWQTSMEKQK